MLACQAKAAVATFYLRGSTTKSRSRDFRIALICFGDVAHLREDAL